jgi:hypothetical protein
MNDFMEEEEVDEIGELIRVGLGAVTSLLLGLVLTF